jgi:PAS domain S-box-containing protein
MEGVEMTGGGTHSVDAVDAPTASTLAGRPSRAPDYQVENRALVALAREMADNPSTVLQKVADLVMELCRAGSAGVSILEADETGGGIFRSHAVSGAWAKHVRDTMPRDASPCGTVFDRNACMLFAKPARRFPAIGLVDPPVAEMLMAPIHTAGKPVGTVWAITHDPRRNFDAEDNRLLASMARFASGAQQAIVAAERLARLAETLEQQVAARTADRNRLWQLSTDIMFVTRFDGIITAVNPAWTIVLGWTEPELIGHNLFHLIHPDDLERTIASVKRLSEGATLRPFDNRYCHKDGSYRWIEWGAVPGDGLINAVGREVTAAKEQAEALRHAEEQLRQSQKMEAVGQLTGGIAHDFNNLLTGIIGSLDLIRRRLDAERTDGLDRFIDAASTSAQRAAALTHRLLAFARRQSLDTKPSDVNALVIGMEDMLHRTLGETIAVAMVSQADLWPALTDANQLENALLNLAINARDAMPNGGQLTVETENTQLDASYAQLNDVAAGDYVAISVSDTGSGMNASVIAKAFDPFFTTKPLGQGTGLGLSMIYGFAKQSGGHARIYSEVGRGTTVKLYLRRAIHDGTVVEPEASSPRGQGEMVLVVEDDATVRLLVTEVLNELGYRYLEAADARTAIPILESGQKIDLLVTDVGLPHMNGRQLAEIARQHRPTLKVLFVTGYAESAAVRGGFLAPGMEMMTKPFALHALGAKIRALIES